MNFLKAAFLFAASAVIAIAPPGLMLARGMAEQGAAEQSSPEATAHLQGPDSQTLLHPPVDSWPGYHGDYSGRRHSSLTQITPANVNDLGLAWAFQTSQNASIKSTP